MRYSIVALVAAILVLPLGAEPVHVTVITKDGRRSGTISAGEVEVKTEARTATKVSFGDVASIQFGDVDVVRTKQGRRVKGIVRVEGWTLHEKDAEQGLSR